MAVPAFPQIPAQLRQANQTMREPGREHPAFPVAMAPVKPAHMVNDAQPAHLASDSFQHPGGETVVVAERRQGGEELPRRVLELHKYRQEDLLLVPIPREQEPRELIQALDSRDPVVAQLDLGARRIFHPHLFAQNKAFEGPLMILGGVKIFSVQARPLSENRPLPQTVRFRASPAPWGRLTAREGPGHRPPTSQPLQALGGQ